MADSPRSGRKSSLRTVVFAALAAVVLLSLAAGLFLPGEDIYKQRRAELYRRGGDTFVHMFYLARVGGWEEQGRWLLHWSNYHYQLSVVADPSDVRSAASLALVLSLLGEDREASSLLAAMSNQEDFGSERSQLAATLGILYSSPPREEYTEAAGEFLRGLAPGRMVLADAYDRIGRRELADREWRAAEEQAFSVLNRIMAMLAVCGFLLGAGVIGLMFAIVRRLRRSKTTAEPATKEAIAANWGVREAVEALILWLFAAMVAAVVLVVLLPAEKSHEVVYQLLVGLVAGVPAIAWVLLVSPSGTRLGWRLAGWWRQVAVGVSAAGLSAGPVLVLHQFLQNLQVRHLYLRPRSLPAELPEEHPLVPLFVGEQEWQWRAMLIVGACVLLPILEETLFRGILYRALRRQWSFAPAAVGSAAIFAVIHLSWVGMVPYLLLGLVFAYLYERSGSLVAPWAAHGAFNAFNLAILLTMFG